jgi:hypothetical protein
MSFTLINGLTCRSFWTSRCIVSAMHLWFDWFPSCFVVSSIEFEVWCCLYPGLFACLIWDKEVNLLEHPETVWSISRWRFSLRAHWWLRNYRVLLLLSPLRVSPISSSHNRAVKWFLSRCSRSSWRGTETYLSCVCEVYHFGPVSFTFLADTFFTSIRFSTIEYSPFPGGDSVFAPVDKSFALLYFACIPYKQLS